MREQLIQYVTLLFAGAKGSEEIYQEILQNTLDRYDDMIAQGKTPESAYRLAISGIGDINEILGSVSHPYFDDNAASSPASSAGSVASKLLRAAAVGLYILSPVPLIVLSEMKMDTLGLCGTLFFIAAATVLLLLVKKRNDTTSHSEYNESPHRKLSGSIRLLIWVIGIGVYFLISFSTHAWFITWVIFPMIWSVQGIIKGILDLQEG